MRLVFYERKPNSKRAQPTFSLQEVEKLKQIIPNLPSLSGSIFGGSTLDAPKGFYGAFKFKPSADLLSSSSRTCSLQSAAWAAIKLGMDIMKWF